MKICFVIDRYPPRPHSSIGSFTQAIARGLCRRGHEVTVVDLAGEAREADDQGARVFTLRRSNLRYVGNLVTRVRLRRWLCSRVKAGQIQVIEVPDYSGFLPFGVNGCPVVVRLHQTGSATRLINGQKLARGFYYYERRNLATNRNWIGVSQHILDRTQELFHVTPKRSVVIYNPVLPIPPIPSDPPDLPNDFVLFVGELTRRKGALVLAVAARDFLSVHPDLHLVYVGSVFREAGQLMSEDILHAVGPEFSKRVRFLGYLDRGKVVACMKRAKVFAFPSRFEAMPLVPLEAMSCAVPVVCMSCPPGPEIVRDGVTGLLADPTSARDLSEKVSLLLDDRELANRLAVNARRDVAERFSFDRCLKETERFYEVCMRN